LEDFGVTYNLVIGNFVSCLNNFPPLYDLVACDIVQCLKAACNHGGSYPEFGGSYPEFGGIYPEFSHTFERMT